MLSEYPVDSDGKPIIFDSYKGWFYRCPACKTGHKERYGTDRQALRAYKKHLKLYCPEAP